MAYETFDIDLRNGKAREDAFVHVFLRSRVEHKRDYEFINTGNIAIEYEQVYPDGEARPSGIAITTADWWATEFLENCWLVLPTARVKELARKAIRTGRHKWIGDGGNHHNALVPIDWFIREAAE